MDVLLTVRSGGVLLCCVAAAGCMQRWQIKRNLVTLLCSLTRWLALPVNVIVLCPQPQQEAAGADSDDDWSMGAKKGGKKGKAATAGKGKGGKASTNNSSSGAAGGKQQQQKGGADANSILSLNVLAQQVLDLYPDMEDTGEP